MVVWATLPKGRTRHALNQSGAVRALCGAYPGYFGQKWVEGPRPDLPVCRYCRPRVAGTETEV